MSARPCVLAYRNRLLPISETFVYNQTIGLERYKAYILGAKTLRGPAIALPPDRVHLINEGGPTGWLREFRWKILGHVPEDVLGWARNVPPALVHAHFGPDGAVVMPLAKRLGLPLIVSFHGTDATMKDWFAFWCSYMTHRLFLLRRGRLTQMSARAVVPSEWLRSLVVSRHGFPEHKVRVIRHGVDLDLFHPAPGSNEWGHVLYVGRLIERKGLPYLIEALRFVKERFAGVRLTVIGDGPMRARYEQLARASLGPQVIFLGSQSHEVVREYLQRSYVLCMPSVAMPSGEAESLGVVFLEAMAMQVPPVSFRSGGVPEVILHGKTGLLADERDIRGLAQHLTILLENRALRDEMGRAGRRWVEAEFNLQVQNRKLEDLYDEVVAEHRRGHGPRT